VSAVEADAFAPEGDEHEDREHYKIGGKAEADWALRKLARAKAAVAENDALYQLELDRLTEWQGAANRPHELDIEYFEAILRNWHQEQLDADPKAKTIKLPAGTLSARQNPTSITITDPEAFIAWAKANQPGWVRTKAEPAKSEIKDGATRKDDKLIDGNGEVIPGVEMADGDVSWKAVTS
jgi:hypothetical protein